MMAVFFFISRENGFKFHAQPQTGACSCLFFVWPLCPSEIWLSPNLKHPSYKSSKTLESINGVIPMSIDVGNTTEFAAYSPLDTGTFSRAQGTGHTQLGYARVKAPKVLLNCERWRSTLRHMSNQNCDIWAFICHPLIVSFLELIIKGQCLTDQWNIICRSIELSDR